MGGGTFHVISIVTVNGAPVLLVIDRVIFTMFGLVAGVKPPKLNATNAGSSVCGTAVPPLLDQFDAANGAAHGGAATVKAHAISQVVLASFICTTKAYCPVVVGVPDSEPDEFKVMPGGILRS